MDGDFPDCYRCLEHDANHLNHQIRVRQSVGLSGGISIRNIHLATWYPHLQGHRVPIAAVPEREAKFRALVQQLEGHPELAFPESSLSEFLDEARSLSHPDLRAYLQQISHSNGPISLEAVVEWLLTSRGYVVEARNRFDRRGGDVDLICTFSGEGEPLFRPGDRPLHVQVKKHTRRTGAEAVKQLLGGETELGVTGCVLSLADEFTTEAAALAEPYGIHLVNGDRLCRLLYEQLRHA